MYSLTESLTQLLCIPSIAGDRRNCELALEYMIDTAKDLGLSATGLMDGRVCVIEAGEGDEVLGIITHVDVANPGNRSDWAFPPFQPVVSEGRMYGRGVVDNKGAAVTAMYAMRDIAKTSYKRNIPMHKKIRLIVGTEKLTGGKDMKDYLRMAGAPDYSFAPDGVFPVGNMIQGTMNVLLSFPIYSQGAVITDIRAGLNHETIPPVCRVTLSGGRRFAARGKAVHTAEYQKGSNAILNLAASLESLRIRERSQLQDDTIYRVLRKLNFGFEDAEGVRAGMPNTRMPYRFEDPGANRFVPTAVFVSEGRLFLNLNIHDNIVTPEEQIIDALEEYFRENRGRVERIMVRPAVYTGRGSRFVQEFREAYEHVSGENIQYRICTYDTCAQDFPSAITFGPVMPGTPDTRNQVNESIRVRDLMFMQTLFERVMSNIVFVKDSFRETAKTGEQV